VLVNIQATRAQSFPPRFSDCRRCAVLSGVYFHWLVDGTPVCSTFRGILRILLLSTIALAGNRVGGNIVLGLGKHKPLAVWQSFEAAVNLTLSIYLVRKIGMDGVAWGTVLPSLVSQIVLWPRYLSKLLDLAVWSYFRECWIRTALAIAPFCLACFCMDRYWVVTSMVGFFLQIAAVLPLIPLGIALCFWKEVNWQLRNQDSIFRRTVVGFKVSSTPPK